MSYIFDLFILAVRSVQQLIWDNERADISSPVEAERTAPPEIPTDLIPVQIDRIEDQLATNDKHDAFLFKERCPDDHGTKMPAGDSEKVETASTYDAIVMFLQFGESEAQLRLSKQFDVIAPWNDPVELFAF
jgi:hypothetical protein